MNEKQHKIDRELVKWGTRGIDNKQPLNYNPISTMSNQHLHACLLTQCNMSKHMKIYMQNELAYREKHPELKINENKKGGHVSP